MEALFLFSGCIESTTLLDVKRDGSGRIVVREFLSPQVARMMEGMRMTFLVRAEGEIKDTNASYNTSC